MIALHTKSNRWAEITVHVAVVVGASQVHVARVRWIGDPGIGKVTRDFTEFTFYSDDEVGYAVRGLTRKEGRRGVWAMIEMLGMQEHYPKHLKELTGTVNARMMRKLRGGKHSGDNAIGAVEGGTV